MFSKRKSVTAAQTVNQENRTFGFPHESQNLKIVIVTSPKFLTDNSTKELLQNLQQERPTWDFYHASHSDRSDIAKIFRDSAPPIPQNILNAYHAIVVIGDITFGFRSLDNFIRSHIFSGSTSVISLSLCLAEKVLSTDPNIYNPPKAEEVISAVESQALPKLAQHELQLQKHGIPRTKNEPTGLAAAGINIEVYAAKAPPAASPKLA